MESTRTVRYFFLILFLLSFAGLAKAPADSVNQKSESLDSVFVMSKSPWVAVGLSAIAPGAGQIYNASYWKAPVVWGIQGWLVYNFIINDRDYRNNADLYSDTKDYRYKKIRDFYHDQRDQFGTYILLTYMLTLVDAYVDAHLFDFTVEETPLGRIPTVKMQIGF